MELPEDQRLKLMQLAINSDQRLTQIVSGSIEELNNIPDALDVKNGVTVPEIISVLEIFGKLDLKSGRKILYQLEVNPSYEPIKQALEVYQALGELGDLIQDLKIIQKNCAVPPEHWVHNSHKPNNQEHSKPKDEAPSPASPGRDIRSVV